MALSAQEFDGLNALLRCAGQPIREVLLDLCVLLQVAFVHRFMNHRVPQEGRPFLHRTMATA
jgi:hypothetical protein